MKKMPIQSLMLIMLLNGSALAGDNVPPPPGPYTPSSSPNMAVLGLGGDDMRQRHESMMKAHEETVRKRRQEMIERYQALREQGFRPEREEKVRSTTTLKPAEPEWVRKQREAMQAMRERHAAEREKWLARQRESLDRTGRQDDGQAMNMPRPGPMWQYPVPPYPMSPHVYGAPFPPYPARAWGARPPVVLHVPVPMTRMPSTQGE